MEDDPVSKIITQLVLVVVLTLVNAFFASAEMASVSVNRNKIKIMSEDGNKKAKALLKLLEEPSNFLSTIQIAITLSGFLNSASTANTLSPYLGEILQAFNIPQANNVAIVLITIVLSYITLVFGELLPKRVAMQKSEQVALASIGVVSIIAKITAPFVKFLSASTNVMLRLFGMKTEGIEEEISKEEIKSLVEVGQETGVFNETEKEMINSIFTFDDKLAKEVMTPRTEVFAINIADDNDTIIREMLDSMYSRIPVYEEEIDNIIGILYMKDYFAKAYEVGFANVDIRSILQTPYFVPERKNINVLFKELQETKTHIAILVDEYGGFSGIVTIEDLVEEIFGEIEDEFDDEEPEIIEVADNQYRLLGKLHIADLNEKLGLSFDENSEEYDSVAGLILDILGYIPDSDAADVEYENYIFQIEAIQDNRIESVIMTINKEENTKIAEEAISD
jgi:Hemolysins and related proteins containing CBS domains